LLRVSHLSKRFEELIVLKDFELTVPTHGFTVLIGPSGCGKSTLFDLLSGIVPREEGHISWHGMEVPDLGSKAAYMQQKDLLLPWLSLFNNALLPAQLAGQSPGKAREEALSLFRQLGLHGFEAYPPGKVSGGMRQRCALVRTLMFKRELALLDEPLSALDAITRRTLHGLLLMLQHEFKKSILMITHDVEEALLLADELLVLTRPPMRIRERFVLDTPKPRRADTVEFLRIKEHVLKGLQEDLIHEMV